MDEITSIVLIFILIFVGHALAQGLVAIFVAVFVVIFVILAGIFWSIHRKKGKIKDPAPGMLEVTATPMREPQSTYQTATIVGVLHADGIPSRAVEVFDLVRGERMPACGSSVPVIYCRRDPDQVRIQWDGVPKAADRARELAEQRAALANSGGTSKMEERSDSSWGE